MIEVVRRWNIDRWEVRIWLSELMEREPPYEGWMPLEMYYRMIEFQKSMSSK